VVCPAASVNQGSVNEISQIRTDPSAASGLYGSVMSESTVGVTPDVI